MWNFLLACGDAYAGHALLRAAGVRAAWKMLMPADAAAWFVAQPWSDAQLARVGKQWGQVWWRYLRSLCGVRAAPLPPAGVVCLVEAGFTLLRTDPRARSTFAAILLQLALQGRHDQSVCCLRANPLAPPFYDLYVDRSHTASLVSLRSLLGCEHTYACAKRAVDKFRRVQGRVVAEIAQGGGVDFMRLPRSKVKRFKCAGCTKHVKSRCKKCTRLQPQNKEGLVEYWGHHRQWVPAADVHTVCADVEFVPVHKMPALARVAHGGNTYTFRKAHVEPVEDPVEPTKPARVRVRLEGTGQPDLTLEVPRHSMLAVVGEQEDGFAMLRDQPQVVHTMRVSVNLDQTWRKRRPQRRTRLSPHRTVPLRVAAPTAAEQVWSYALWRGLAGVACSADEAVDALVRKHHTHAVCNRVVGDIPHGERVSI